MITVSALLIPFMVFLFWTVVALCVEDKTMTQKKLTALLAISTIYFYIDAFYLLPNASAQDYKILIFLDIFSQFITVSLPTSIVAFVLSYRERDPKPTVLFLMYSPGIILGTAAIIIYSLMGTDTAAAFVEAMDNAGEIPVSYNAPIFKIHEAVCQKTYNIILLTEVLIALAVVIVNLSRYPLRKGALNNFIDGKEKLPSFTAECILLVAILTICSIRIGLGRHYLLNTPGISSLLSIIVGVLGCLCAYIGISFPDREFDLWDFRHPMSLRASETGPISPDPVIDVPAVNKVKAIGQSERMSAPPTLLEQFISYMAEKKPYLNPNLSISDVAHALRSNRTYISVLINENFEKNFRDYINALRIEHAKQIMLKNPDEILEVIAEKSGFGSDSQFAKKFKEVENISPKQWLAKQLSLK